MKKLILTIILILFVSIGNTKSIYHICEKTSKSLINLEEAITQTKLNSDEDLKQFTASFKRQLEVAKLYHYLDCREELGG